MGAKDIPVWEKYTLTIEEAARYFRIGEGKLRRLASEMPPPDWVVMNGNRVQVKRKAFERFIDSTAGLSRMKKSLGDAIMEVAYQGSFHMEGAIYGCHRKDETTRIGY